MSNQEMQFADPDWRPRNQKDGNIESPQEEPYIPQPVNAEQHEQQQWQAPPPEPGMYRGTPYTSPPAQQMGSGAYRQRSYRRRSPWLWIIAALIIFSLIGSFGSSFRNHDVGIHYGFPAGPGNTIEKTFSVNGAPTVVINENAGNITINADSADSNNVIVRETGGFNNFGGKAQLPQISTDGNTITINDNNDQKFLNSGPDLNITVPTSANLNIQTSSGNIEVDNVTGQLILKSNSGDITARQDTLSNQSTLTTNNGDITYSGDINSTGTYNFEAGSGNMNVTLPANPAFSVNATTNNGSINSDFSSVQPNAAGTAAQGNVGSSPQAKVILHTDSGDINLNQQSQ